MSTYPVRCEVNSFVNDAVRPFSERFENLEPLADFVPLDARRLLLAHLDAVPGGRMGNVLVDYAQRLAVVQAVVGVEERLVGGESMLFFGVPVGVHARIGERRKDVGI
jgi:hypothetical protein